MEFLVTESAKMYQQWVLGRILNQISRDLEQVRSMQLSLQESSYTINSKTGRHLVEVYQELQSEQELR